MSDFAQGSEVETADRPKENAFSITIDDEEKDKILTYLLAELDSAIAARANRVKKWNKWRKQREAVPETPSGEHMVDNASRVTPPLTQIHAQTSYAKVKGYFDTGKPYFWQVQSPSSDPEDHKDAKLLTEYLGILANSPMDLNMAKIKRTVSDEATFMGLLMVKVVWDTMEWKFKADEDGSGIPTSQTMTFHDGPSIIPIPQEDTLYPPFWDDVQRMPWIAHTLHYPLHEFLNNVAEGKFAEPMDDRGIGIDPKTWLREDFTDSEEESDRIRGFESRGPKVIDLYEFHFYWDIDNDGIWEDLIFTIHRDSKTLLRAVYNTIAAREFEAFGFIPRSFVLESRGVGQICEPLQDEVTGTHRLRNDAMKLSAIKMLVMRRTVLRENKNTIYQGKVWITDNPREDMNVVGLGEVPPSSLQSENMVWSLTAQAVGLSSVERGFSDPTLGTRDTFKGQQLRLQQSESIMSTIIESTSESWSRVGMLVFFQLVRNSKRVIWNERQLGRLKAEDIDRLERILSIKMSDIPRKLKFGIYTTDIEHSFEVRRETIMQLMQLTAQSQPQLVQLAMQLFGPQGAQLKQLAPDAWEQLLEVYVGSVKILKEVYAFADFSDTENYLQDVSKWEKLIDIMRSASADRMKMLDAARNQGGMNGNGQAIGVAGGPPVTGVPAPGPEGAPGSAASTELPPEIAGVGAGAGIQ
jgi:hypothetical protein